MTRRSSSNSARRISAAKSRCSRRTVSSRRRTRFRQTGGTPQRASDSVAMPVVSDDPFEGRPPWLVLESRHLRAATRRIVARQTFLQRQWHDRKNAAVRDHLLEQTERAATEQYKAMEAEERKQNEGALTHRIGDGSSTRSTWRRGKTSPRKSSSRATISWRSVTTATRERAKPTTRPRVRAPDHMVLWRKDADGVWRLHRNIGNDAPTKKNDAPTKPTKRS